MRVFLGTVLDTLSNMRSNNDNHGGHFYSALSVHGKHRALQDQQKMYTYNLKHYI